MTRITGEEISFLLARFNLPIHLKKKLFKRSVLSRDDIAYLWDLCGDEVGIEVDKDYMPTSSGRILENLVDKFYEMGENYDPDKQYQLS
jgi:hypothetical protein